MSIKHLTLSGLEPLVVNDALNFVNVGERTNVAGSKKFLRLIKEEQFEEALKIARDQVEGGAQILDVNMDDALLEAKECMVDFLNLIDCVRESGFFLTSEFHFEGFLFSSSLNGKSDLLANLA